MEYQKQLKVNVAISDLSNVVKVRMSGISDAIRTLRNKKPRNKDEDALIKESISFLKQARSKTNIVLNKLQMLLKKGIFEEADFIALKEEFMQMTLKKENSDTRIQE